MSYREKVEEVREEVEKASGMEDRLLPPNAVPERFRRKKYGVAVALAATLALTVLLPYLELQGEDAPDPSLSQYQQDYVDCPERYLETCTAMSRIPTEEVSFWKVEGDRLFLKMDDGRAIVSTVPNGTPGEFVTMMSESEVPDPNAG